MNFHDPVGEIICPCSGTTRQAIINLIDSGRVSRMDDISTITGACSGCGACDAEVKKTLAEYTQHKT